MVHDDRSNLIKLPFAEDESVVSSTICEDLADQNQIQSRELTNPNPSNTIETSENESLDPLLDSISQFVSKEMF